MGGTTVSYQLQVPAPTPAPLLPSGAGVASGAPAFLGRGIVTPFRRAASDFANATGIALLESCVGQVLGTTCDSPRGRGELPWRTDFGSVLQRIRHLPNNAALGEFARAYVADALIKWEPRVRSSSASIVQDPRTPRVLAVQVTFTPITANVPANRVAIQAGSVTVQVGS